MNKKICLAIKSRNIVVFNYNSGSRKLEPYCYGLSKKGKELLRAYQISGYSSSGKSEGWKLFNISKISNLKILNEIFQKTLFYAKISFSELKFLFFELFK